MDEKLVFQVIPCPWWTLISAWVLLPRLDSCLRRSSVGRKFSLHSKIIPAWYPKQCGGRGRIIYENVDDDDDDDDGDGDDDDDEDDDKEDEDEEENVTDGDVEDDNVAEDEVEEDRVAEEEVEDDDVEDDDLEEDEDENDNAEVKLRMKRCRKGGKDLKESVAAS